MMLTLSGNCATNCEFHLQLAHSQLQLPITELCGPSLSKFQKPFNSIILGSTTEKSCNSQKT